MATDDSPDIGARVKLIREALRYTPSDVARAAGIDRMTLIRIEEGHSKSPRVDTLRSIMRALHMTDDGCARMVAS